MESGWKKIENNSVEFILRLGGNEKKKQFLYEDVYYTLKAWRMFGSKPQVNNIRRLFFHCQRCFSLLERVP